MDVEHLFHGKYRLVLVSLWPWGHDLLYVSVLRHLFTCLAPSEFTALWFVWVKLSSRCVFSVRRSRASCVFGAHPISALVLGDFLNSDISRFTKPTTSLALPRSPNGSLFTAWELEPEGGVPPSSAQLQVLIGWLTPSTLCMYPQVTTGAPSVNLLIHLGKQMDLRRGSRVEWSCEMLEMSF